MYPCLLPAVRQSCIPMAPGITDKAFPAGHARGLGSLVDFSSAWSAAAWYLAATIVLTWPLVLGLTRDIPADFGDSLLNCWILGWGADHLARFFGGDLGALRGYWNANIFHPEPLALAYSEHLFAQTVQILPVFAVTRNLILCYNLIFLSTFVLSALGMYLLVREITGDARAAFVAGLFYGFAPYRVPQFAHVQVMSSQWMPFVLYALRRHFDSRRLLPLAGATIALIAQNLSNGYFLVYFSPFVAAYVLFEVISRRRGADLRQWIALGVSATVVAAATWPFLRPYLELRALGLPPRSLDEVQSFSANVYSYLTVSPQVTIAWRWFHAFLQSEGELFPGTMPILFALVAVVPRIWSPVAGWHRRLGPLSPVKRALAYVVLGVVALHLLFAFRLLLFGSLVVRTGVATLRVSSLNRSLLIAAAGIIVLRLAAGRAVAHSVPRTDSFYSFSLAATLAAFWLSLGPWLRTLRERLDWGPYLLLYRYVPGFDGLRVPARLGMLVMLFLAVLAGVGAADIVRRWKRGGLVVLVAGLAFLVEGSSIPIETNCGNSPPADLAVLPARLATGADVPPVYRFLRSLPPKSVVIEFPFGEIPSELRYMYYSTEHWRPLVNGFSGSLPGSYLRRYVLRRPLANPDEAWLALRGSGATNAVVHEDYFSREGGTAVSQWLAGRGAVVIATFGKDRVFEIR
jgi:hypothetical protein